jgi:hypothetical protein
MDVGERAFFVAMPGTVFLGVGLGFEVMLNPYLFLLLESGVSDYYESAKSSRNGKG